MRCASENRKEPQIIIRNPQTSKVSADTPENRSQHIEASRSATWRGNGSASFLLPFPLLKNTKASALDLQKNRFDAYAPECQHKAQKACTSARLSQGLQEEHKLRL